MRTFTRRRVLAFLGAGALAVSAGCVRQTEPVLAVGVVDPCPMHGEKNPEAPYMRALRQAGHEPYLIAFTTNRAEIADQLKRVDLVLFLGGEDVAPFRYGEEKSPRCEEVNERRDVFEWAVLDACVERRLPVFGICRGVQLLNCYFGGTLYQDINTEIPNLGRHRYKAPEPRGYIDHEVEIADASRLKAVLNRSRVSTKTWHHQAVERLAHGFRVSARTADGVVEAIESDDYPAAGVQFHPEQSVEADPASPLLAIFRQLPRLCGF